MIYCAQISRAETGRAHPLGASSAVERGEGDCEQCEEGIA